MKNPNRDAGKRREENEEIVRPDTLVIASGKYGSCNQYTKWMIDRTGCDAIPFDKRTLGYASLYKNIVYIGAIRETVISNLNMLWQNYNNFGLNGKKIIVCGVGIGDPSDEGYIDKVMKRSGAGPDFCSRYILPGRIDMSRLRLLDKPIFDKFLIDAERQYGSEMAELIRSRAESDYNGVDAAALDPIINEILATRE